MRILSLSVRSWKGLDHVELADLAPDLNLIVGPNESGKSRLALALRYALFEKYKGESEDKKALRSYGSAEAPYVEVRFEARGATWTVRKQFLKQAFAKLEGSGRTWTDEDAETMLRELLGTRPSRGEKTWTSSSGSGRCSGCGRAGHERASDRYERRRARSPARRAREPR